MTAKKSTSPRVPKFSAASEETKRTRQILFGGFLILISLLLFIAFTSYFFSWEQDQSTLGAMGDRSVQSVNILSKLGAWVSDFFIFQLFGFSAFILTYLFCITGLVYFFNINKKTFIKTMDLGIILHPLVCFTFWILFKNIPFVKWGNGL